MRRRKLFESDRIQFLKNPKPPAGTRMVAIAGDRIACPETLTPRVRFREGTGIPPLDFEIQLGETGPECTAIRVAEGGQLTGEVLRKVPLAAVVRGAVAHAARQYTHDQAEGIGSGFELNGETVYTLDSIPAQEEKRGTVEDWAKSSRRAQAGIPVTDDDLQQVASEYRQALKGGRNPTAEVARIHHVSRSTASRWVRKARNAGYLGEAHAGRAG